MKTRCFRFTALLLLTVFMLGTSPGVLASGQVSAQAAGVSLSLNGELVKLGAYNIGGSNYVKLRDVAQLLRGTEKGFSVTWRSEDQSIYLQSGGDYLSVGGELAPLAPGVQSAVPCRSTVWVNSGAAPLTAYNIGGNNFFRLRDLGITLDFHVDWDDSTGTVLIDTSRGFAQTAEVSDQELLILAGLAANVMQDSIYGVNAGAYPEQDWDNYTTINGRECYPVPGYRSMADLENKWYQSFSRKYTMAQITGGDFQNMYTEQNGQLYSFNLGIGDDMESPVVEKLVSRSRNEAVFSGRIYCEPMEDFDGTMELSLVFENGAWKYGYFKKTE